MEWLTDCIRDANITGLDRSDAGSSVPKSRNKSKKKVRAVINDSSDDEEEGRVESRSVLDVRISEVEQTRTMLWSQALDQGISLNNSR